jgi:hypothetical protein
MKKSLNPVIIFFTVILVCLNLVYIACIYGHLIQSGGEKTLNSLVYSYKTAVNDGDSKAYMKLVPICERTSSEKAYVKGIIGEYSGKNYDMEYVDAEELDQADHVRVSAKMFLINPFNSPIVTDSKLVKVKVTGEDTKYLSLNVVKINGRYFIDDINID